MLISKTNYKPSGSGGVGGGGGGGSGSGRGGAGSNGTGSGDVGGSSGRDSQCSLYQAVTGKIYHLKQHFLPLTTT